MKYTTHNVGMCPIDCFLNKTAWRFMSVCSFYVVVVNVVGTYCVAETFELQGIIATQSLKDHTRRGGAWHVLRGCLGVGMVLT